MEPKRYFYYIIGNHAEPGDDPAGEQDGASVVSECFIFLNALGYYYDI